MQVEEARKKKGGEEDKEDENTDAGSCGTKEIP
jgi:hypothetical protein